VTQYFSVRFLIIINQLGHHHALAKAQKRGESGAGTNISVITPQFRAERRNHVEA
jgi:hypothetical protein